MFHWVKNPFHLFQVVTQAYMQAKLTIAWSPILLRNLQWGIYNQGTNFTAATDFANTSTTWSVFTPANDRYATDAMWGQERTYDFYHTVFGRNSVDNAGLALVGYVHSNLVAMGYPNNINAFWNTQAMVYGDGGVSGGVTVNPLTALDITGHEITHGVTQYTSNLAYNKESGAMNESFSDMMGTSIEFYGKLSSANWTIGENIGITLRSLSNPKLYSQPNTYGGTNWFNITGCSPNSSNDNCGVHTNSGVGNYWFYLLAMGGSGNNDLGNSYSVNGLGIAEAQAIAFRTFTIYLTSTSAYTNARAESIIAAGDLYGSCSNEVVQVTNAWHAVGVGAAFPVNSGYTVTGSTPVCTSQSFTINGLPSGSTVSWNENQPFSSPSLSFTTGTSNPTTITFLGGPGVDIPVNASVLTPGTGCVETGTKIVHFGPPSNESITNITLVPYPYYGISGTVVTDAPSPYYWYIDGVLKKTTASYFSDVVGGGACGVQHYFQVGVTNGCGSQVKTSPYYFTNHCGPGAFMMSPNPANSSIIVSEMSRLTNDSAANMESTAVQKGPSGQNIKSGYTSNQAVGIREIEIYNSQGQLLKKVEYDGIERATVDVSSLISGVYIVKITSSAIVESQKLIIQK